MSERERFKLKLKDKNIKLKRLENEIWSKRIISVVVIAGTVTILVALFIRG